MNLEELYTQIDTANRMADTATAFLASLRPDQAATAQLTFGNENARRDWHYIPRDRLGLALKDMEAHQRDKAFALLDTGLSEQARTKARTIINLEPILAEVEGPRRRFPRDPDLYNLVIFGTPGSDAHMELAFLKAITSRSTTPLSTARSSHLRPSSSAPIPHRFDTATTKDCAPSKKKRTWPATCSPLWTATKKSGDHQ